jgi:hypothetical protein
MRYFAILMAFGVVLGAGVPVGATGVIVATDNLGYQGTIWNITDTTGPWATSTPRDASVYFTSNVPWYYSDYNQLMSSWFEQSLANQNDSFIQLADAGNTTVTSASGSWDSTLKVFALTVTGQDAPYPWSRMWQPDNGVAWGVTFTDYTYTLTATFGQAADPYLDGYVNSVDPTSIVGSFSGQFVVTDDVNKNPITNGDTYGFSIDLSKGLFTNDGGTYGTITPYNVFFGPTAGTGGAGVPEPVTMAGVFLGVGSLVTYLRKRRTA